MRKIFSIPSLRPKSLYLGCCLAVILLAVSSACSAPTPGSIPTDPPDAPPASQAPPIEGKTNDLPATENLDAALEASAAQDIRSLLGKPDPTANPQPPIILDQWSGLDPVWQSQVFVTFIVKNPNPDWGFSSAPFTITIFDKAGNHLREPAWEDAGPLFPGQIVAISRSYSVPEKSELGKVEIQAGEWVANQPGSQSFPLSVEQVRLIPYADHLSVTGIIKNSFNKDIAYIEAEALAYDQAGKLICGGGGIPISFIPGNGQIAVEERLETTQEPARVDLVPRLMSYSSIEPPSDEIKDVQIAGIGLRLGSNNSADFTAIFENKSQKIYRELYYRYAIYAEDGSVIVAREGNAYILYPDDQVAVLGPLQLPADAQAARADVQFNLHEDPSGINPEMKVLQLKANPLSASPDVTIKEDDYYYNFTGSVSSSLNEDLQGAEVVAVAYDDQGKIIGSNRAYVDIPARGSVVVEVSLMKTPTKPARVVLFPTLPGNWGMN